MLLSDCVRVRDLEYFSKFIFELFKPTVNCGTNHPMVLTNFVLEKHPIVHVLLLRNHIFEGLKKINGERFRIVLSHL